MDLIQIVGAKQIEVYKAPPLFLNNVFIIMIVENRMTLGAIHKIRNPKIEILDPSSFSSTLGKQLFMKKNLT